MHIQVTIPPKSWVTSRGVSVSVARKGERWSKAPLRESANRKGVYVIHHASCIKYVGKTDGPKMSFGVRLRREFQESASQGRHIFPKLSRLKVPPSIKVSFFPMEMVRKLVTSRSRRLSDTQRNAIFEVALQQAYEPQFG